MLKITSENKKNLVLAMGTEPFVSAKEIAEELGYHPNSIRRWMMHPTDEQTKRMLDAINSVKAKKR